MSNAAATTAAASAADETTSAASAAGETASVIAADKTAAASAAGETIRAVLFDAAGTLLLPRESVGACYAAHARAHGVTLSAKRLDEAFARVLRAAAPNLHPGCTPRESARRERAWWRARVRETFRATDQCARFANFDAFFDELWAHYQSARAWRLAPGARAAISALAARGFRLGVLSNFDQRLHALLRAFALREMFDIVLTPADTGFAKPARESFDAACAQLGAPAAHTLYIGDHAAQDLHAARAAGLHALDVAHLPDFSALPALLTPAHATHNERSAHNAHVERATRNDHATQNMRTTQNERDAHNAQASCASGAHRRARISA